MARKIVVAGGTGFIGASLVRSFLKQGCEVVVLTRGSRAPDGARAVRWDGRSAGEWARELDGADALVNLAGETVAQKWTADAKRRILDSRVQAVSVLCDAVRSANRPPTHWINASAVGFYGDRGDAVLDEASPAGEGFLAETCLAWEDALFRCPVAGTAKTVVRIGVVLGNGGALETMSKLARFGLGGRVGSGNQYMSWIHLDDLIGLIQWCLDQPNPPTVINGTSPEPATNRDFMRTLRNVVKAPFGLPAPTFGVKLLGQTIGPDADLMLTSTRVIPKTAIDQGYKFQHPHLREAMASIL